MQHHDSEAPTGVFEYGNPREIHYGKGSARHLRNALEAVGASRVHIVTARSLLDSASLRYLQDQTPVLRQASISTAAGHTPVSDVIRAARAVQDQGATAIVALGGGSAIDAVKFASVVTAAVHGDFELQKVAQVMRDPRSRAELPIFAIPTTLSAAELYGDGGFTAPETGQKVGVRNSTMTPTAVFYDPIVTLDTPRALWVSTGMRAMDHAIETILSPAVDPISATLAIAAVRELIELLPRFTQEGATEADRVRCQIAAWKSYFNPPLASSGLSHVIGRAIGAKNGIPHGVTSCIVLPNVIRYLSSTDHLSRYRLDALSDSVGLAHSSSSTSPLADELLRIVEAAGIPSRLTRAEFDARAEEEAAQLASESSGQPVAAVRGIIDACVA